MYCRRKGDDLHGVLMPLGEYHKREVRQMVAEPFKGLRILSKKESMGIWFVKNAAIIFFFLLLNNGLILLEVSSERDRCQNFCQTTYLCGTAGLEK